MESVPLLLKAELTLLYVSDLINCTLPIMPYIAFLSSVPSDNLQNIYGKTCYHLTQLQVFEILFSHTFGDHIVS